MRYVHSCAILIFSYITYHEHMPGKHMIYNTATTCSTSVHIVVTMARSYHDPLQTSGCFAGSACIGLKMTCGISIINERLESRCNAVKRWMWKVETWTVYIVTIYHVSVSLSLSLPLSICLSISSHLSIWFKYVRLVPTNASKASRLIITHEVGQVLQNPTASDDCLNACGNPNWTCERWSWRWWFFLSWDFSRFAWIFEVLVSEFDRNK